MMNSFRSLSSSDQSKVKELLANIALEFSNISLSDPDNFDINEFSVILLKLKRFSEELFKIWPKSKIHVKNLNNSFHYLELLVNHTREWFRFIDTSELKYNDPKYIKKYSKFRTLNDHYAETINKFFGKSFEKLCDLASVSEESILAFIKKNQL